MKCQILFSGKNKKKYFKMLSAENFTRSAKLQSGLRNNFDENAKSCFLEKIRKTFCNMYSVENFTQHDKCYKCQNYCYALKESKLYIYFVSKRIVLLQLKKI